MWKPEFQSYKDALEAAEEITPDDLADAMEEIPQEIRERLAAGPLPRRWDCGVCVAFGDYVKKLDGNSGAVDLSDPAWRVFIYHEVPKVRMTHGDQRHYGPLANESYERTIATYRAAGWEGEAGEANA